MSPSDGTASFENGLLWTSLLVCYFIPPNVVVRRLCCCSDELVTVLYFLDYSISLFGYAVYVLVILFGFYVVRFRNK